MNSHKGFDRISWIYDFLVRVVFGNSIRKSQVDLIRKAKKGQNWLVIGGGTGWVLGEVFKYHPKVHVTYLEASQAMLDKSSSRNNLGEVDFVLGSVDQIPEDQLYDIAVTNFFWDMFSTSKCMRLKSHIDLRLKNDAECLVADFKNTDIWWQRALIKFMYWFFKITCRIEARRLPNFEELFAKGNQIYKASFHYGMIESMIYQKSN